MNAPEKTVFVQDLVPGRPVAGIFVITGAKAGNAKNGPFWSLNLDDATGSVEAKIWSPQSHAFSAFETGAFVHVEGMVGSYRDKPQITVNRLEILSPETYRPDLTLFIPSGERNPADILRDLEDLLNRSVVPKPWKRYCRRILKNEDIRERLLNAPGAKAIHHSHMGGLLEHTLGVCKICDAFCDLYPGLDRDTLLSAAAFHDLGKAWELTSGVVRDYTDPGRLLGHIYLGLEVLEPFLKKTKGLDPEFVLHFKHIILSHHGEYEYGSPRRPKTPEAFVLHFADNADAKLNTVFGFFPEKDETGWSPYVRSLERFVYNPRRAAREEKNADAPKKDDIQCSLLSKE